MIKKYITMFFILVLFILSLSYNIYNLKYTNDYSIISTGLDTEFEQLKNMINNNQTQRQELMKQLEHIENYVSFQNQICFKTIN